MNEADAIPLLELCWQQLRPASPRGYAMGPQGEDALFAGLFAAKDDPGLAHGVHALFEAACIFHDEEDSPEVAASILRALDRARPQLPLRSQAEEAIWRATSGGLDHVERRAPKLGESAPEGSLKAFRFTKPGRTRG